MTASGEPDRLVIGITGHRDIREDDSKLRRVVAGQIENLRRGLPNQPVTLLTCLAEGADRLVADVASQEFDAELVAPLPFAPDQYEKDFVRPESRAAFRRLLRRCDRWFVAGDGVRKRSDRSWSYACAGAYVVMNCDVLLAIWDGRPARGVGGTGELVEWVRGGRVPETYHGCIGAGAAPAPSGVHIHPCTHQVERFYRSERRAT